MKYRIREIKKEGYYTYYRVEERRFFIWVDSNMRACDTIEECEQLIRDASVEHTEKTVKRINT